MNPKHSPVIVAGLSIAGFVVVLCLLVLKPVNIEDKALTVINVLVGTLATMASNSVQFFIGSSSGSKQKDDVISSALNKPQS